MTVNRQLEQDLDDFDRRYRQLHMSFESAQELLQVETERNAMLDRVTQSALCLDFSLTGLTLTHWFQVSIFWKFSPFICQKEGVALNGFFR